MKRIFWACGCALPPIVWRACAAAGTPDCQRRHLLDRIRMAEPCPAHRPVSAAPAGVAASSPRRRVANGRRRGLPRLPRVVFIHRGSGSGCGNCGTVNGV
ncbi:uncharacterized protein THITE_2116387 [Thermothielavioides terrestris NRRL 8126]|uniref:Secreted protein n=2 Tax=Thermothielavioides terrestris TaxID=2587410 RepID=G2R5R7_THETT|nr:uncharacterized protein THITE_2116387 [Thermothielavioides terrestris NRRL 8126]AEO67506.1 hypothetical protein THITE_2116387 [Thermothielavioides terrestris NRRL 8126]